MTEKTLLIATVGGAPQPIVASIKRWKPERILFVVSPETEPEVEGKIAALLTGEDYRLSPGIWDALCVPSAQDFAECVKKMGELSNNVKEWLGRGASFQVVVDFTGGTKCMTAALALQAHRWPCIFSYVGGTERTKDGVGIVVNGKEQIVQAQNPWNVLGQQALEDAITLFDAGFYGAAVNSLNQWLPRVTDSTVKRELGTCKSLAEAYLAWDAFDHEKAAKCLEEVKKNANDLSACFGSRTKTRLLEAINSHIDYLRQILMAGKTPSIEMAQDLLANAKRCADQQRFDDAVARLYRAAEALAQVRLAEEYAISDTGKVPFENLPPKLKSEFEAKVRRGEVKLALQDCYTFLKEKGDELGERFRGLRLDDPKESPLTARNQSILAHGFAPIGKKMCESLLRAAMDLAGVNEEDLPSFPKLHG